MYVNESAVLERLDRMTHEEYKAIGKTYDNAAQDAFWHALRAWLFERFGVRKTWADTMLTCLYVTDRPRSELVSVFDECGQEIERYYASLSQNDTQRMTFWMDFGPAIARVQAAHPRQGTALIKSYLRQGVTPAREFLREISGNAVLEPERNLEWFAKRMQTLRGLDWVLLEKILLAGRLYLREEPGKQQIREFAAQKHLTHAVEFLGVLESNLSGLVSGPSGLARTVLEDPRWITPYRMKLVEALLKPLPHEAFTLVVKLASRGGWDALCRGEDIGEHNLFPEERRVVDDLRAYTVSFREALAESGIRENEWNTTRKTPCRMYHAQENTDTVLRDVATACQEILGSRKHNRAGILPREKARKIWRMTFKKRGITIGEDGILWKHGKTPLSLREAETLCGEVIAQMPPMAPSYVFPLMPTPVLRPEVAKLQRIRERISSIIENRALETVTVALWARDPFRDLFQGNFLANCISLPEGARSIAGYLLDPGVQIVEVTAGQKRLVGQTFLWLADDAEGKTWLVLDNVEVLESLRKSHAEFLRDAMLSWCVAHARRLGKGIAGVLVGRSNNDASLDHFETKELHVTKRAGMPLPNMHLDAVGGRSVEKGSRALAMFWLIAERRGKSQRLRYTKKQIRAVTCPVESPYVPQPPHMAFDEYWDQVLPRPGPGPHA